MAIPKRANGLDSRKGIHLKNLWSFFIMLIWTDCLNHLTHSLCLENGVTIIIITDEELRNHTRKPVSKETVVLRRWGSDTRKFGLSTELINQIFAYKEIDTQGLSLTQLTKLFFVLATLGSSGPSLVV